MRILLLNQAFYPDVVSTAQHAADLASALVAAGHDVTVIASNRAYDNPSHRFPRHSIYNRVRILRISTTGLGKASHWRRAVDFASFHFNGGVRLLVQPRYDVVIAMTSPPLIGFLAALFVRLKGGQLLSWIMDLNPDEAIAAGLLRPDSTVAFILESILRFTLRTSASIVVLDSFMKQRILDRVLNETGIPKASLEEKLVILPPWSHDSAIAYDETARSQFRAKHGLTRKFVVMYSGNHSPCHPLDTLLKAARRLATSPDNPRDIAFCFIGGGSEFKKVQSFAAANNLHNILCLPYQPLDQLSAALSSADLHVVAMGDPFVGIVHPCKIYNILSLGAPFLYIGPPKSHITELAPDAWLARHGDVEGVTQYILAARVSKRFSSLNRKISARFSEAQVVPSFIRLIESIAGSPLNRVIPWPSKG